MNILPHLTTPEGNIAQQCKSNAVCEPGSTYLPGQPVLFTGACACGPLLCKHSGLIVKWMWKLPFFFSKGITTLHWCFYAYLHLNVEGDHLIELFWEEKKPSSVEGDADKTESFIVCGLCCSTCRVTVLSGGPAENSHSLFLLFSTCLLRTSVQTGRPRVPQKPDCINLTDSICSRPGWDAWSPTQILDIPLRCSPDFCYIRQWFRFGGFGRSEPNRAAMWPFIKRVQFFRH